MAIITLAHHGTHAACWLRGDTVFVAWQDGETLHRMQTHLPSMDVGGVQPSLPLGPNVGAYPVFTTHQGRVILAYRLGEPSFAAVFIDADTGEELHRTPFSVDGNNPIAMGNGYAFAQRDILGTYQIWVAAVGIWKWSKTVHVGRPTGLSRVLNAAPVLVDDDRASQPGMALVSYSPDGRLVAGERADVPGTPDGGVIVRRA